MATIFDAAAYVQGKKLPTHSPLNIQKWLYYAQAWSMVQDGATLFPESFQAWQHGPACPVLWARTDDAGMLVDPALGDESALTPREKQAIDEVLEAYGARESYSLSAKVHEELPWVNARLGLPADASSRNPLSLEEMYRFYRKQGLEEVQVVHNQRNQITPELKANFDARYGEGEADAFLAASASWAAKKLAQKAG